MARTDADLVKGVLLDNYGPKEDGTEPSLTPFISAANLLVTRVAACATARGLTLSTDELTAIETWLAAHYYAVSDRTMSSQSNLGASGSFDGQTSMALDATLFGQHAKVLDHSGCLATITAGGRSRPKAVWLGRRPANQTDSDSRFF